MIYDIIIIGAGPAGISAGIYAVSRGKKVLVIEKEKVGGLIAKVSTVTHYASVKENETGQMFAESLKEQAKNAGIKIIYEEVIKTKLKDETKQVITKDNIYKSKKVIIANGTSPNKLNISGEKELAGKGMLMNAARDCEKYAGKNVYVVGGSDGAAKEAIFLSKYAKQVTIIHFENSLGCIAEFKNKINAAKNIKVKLNSRLHAVYGVEKVESLDISDELTGAIETICDSGCGIFVYAGTNPNTNIYDELELDNGFIATNENMETKINGVYAIGDIREKKIRQISLAVAEGTIAAINASL